MLIGPHSLSASPCLPEPTPWVLPPLGTTPHTHPQHVMTVSLDLLSRISFVSPELLLCLLLWPCLTDHLTKNTKEGHCWEALQREQ